MQDRFNRADFLAKLDAGELLAKVIANAHPTPPESRQPHCTRSQMVEYWTPNGPMVALVHQYLRTDGSIGASGLPDPKKIMIDGVVYRRCKKPCP